jgi:hypothetical protein
VVHRISGDPFSRIGLPVAKNSLRPDHAPVAIGNRPASFQPYLDHLIGNAVRRMQELSGISMNIFTGVPSGTA